jgi:dipeptidyl-peptidase 4
MFRIAILLIISLLVFQNDSFAQSAKKQLTMEEAILKGRSTLAPANLRQLQWLPSSTAFSHVVGHKIVRVQALNLGTDTLDWLPKINVSFEKKGATLLKTLPAMTWISDTSMYFQQDNNVLLFSPAAGVSKIITCPEDFTNTDLHVETMRMAATNEQASVLKIFEKGKETVVVRAEKAGVVVGKSVHREEFGIVKGTFWSPKGSKLAFYRMDESMVTEYPIYVLDSMPATERKIRYPLAGAKSHQVTIGVFDINSEKTIFLQTGDPAEQYLTNISWSNDEKYILVAIVNRAQNQCWLNSYDAETGRFVRTILEETNDKWVEPEVAATFVPNQVDLFLWQSERGGFNHLYLYNLNGKLIRQVSTGAFPVVKFLGFDKKGETCFYQTADESGLNRFIFKSKLTSGEPQKLATEIGTHNAAISFDGKYWLDNFSNETTPRLVFCQKTDVSAARTPFFTAKNPLEDFQLGQTRQLKIESPGGFSLNARMILPTDFDEKKQYPTIVYLYNGPHAQLVTNTWLAGAELWMHRMASLGYVIFTVDGRGSGNRGFQFESAIHRQAGTVEMEDQLAGLAFLKNQIFVDSARIGIYGWSYGGFMATSLMTRHAGAYKVGVAGGPVIDWKMYEIMYTERYMDTPQENPDGYSKSSLFQYVPNLRGKLLMIHGAEDNVVLWQHSLKYVQTCVSAGKQLDYFVYPGHEHNVLGKDRVHLFNKIEDYFFRNL